MPTYGVDQVIRGNRQTGDPPPGWATLIGQSGISIDKIDLFVTGWMEPTHTLESRLGTERIEDGSIITDHVIAMPKRLSMMGMVSDVAMGADSAARCWNEIIRLHQEESILKVITEWAMYPEMVIRRATTTQTGRGMEFTIDLQEIVRVGVSETSAAKDFPGNPIQNLQPPVDAGAKDLVESRDVPVTLLGGGRELVGSVSDPSNVVLRTDADGNYIGFERNDPETGDRTYTTLVPPEE